MKTIWKYPLEITDKQTVDMPKGAQVLSVIAQDDVLTLYALVDPTAPSTVRCQVRIYGTGRPCGETNVTEFVGTAVTHGGALVWHVFVGEVAG